METKLHSLPPLKRFRLLELEEKQVQNPKPESKLPAKKRKQTWYSSDSVAPKTPPNTITSVCLPAKKRVWAVRPETEPVESPRFDLKKVECPTLCLPAKKRVRVIRPDNSPVKSSPFPSKVECTTFSLPAKKRVRVIRPDCSPVKVTPFSSKVECTTLPLPAKKRVWAIPPDFSPVKSSSPSLSFDLNVEYTPSPEKKVVRESTPGTTPIPDQDEPVKSIPDLIHEEEREIKSNVSIPDENESEIHSEKEKPDTIHEEGNDSQSNELNLDVVEKEENDSESNELNPEAVEEEDDGILCAVCESTDGDPSDPIVFCDGCDLMVHASCYGNPLVIQIPEGDWFCSQCSVSKSSVSPQRCCLCPAVGGAMKPTTDGGWAHIVCAVLVPEVFFEESEGREGIDCSKVPKKRWREVCYLCKRRKGCVVECSEPKCPLAFHVTCGLKEELCIELNEGKYSGGVVAGFCKKHTELWKKQQQTGKFKIVARDEDKL